MRRNPACVAVLCAALSPNPGRADTLAEAAAREKARRKGEPAKAFSEEDLKSTRESAAGVLDTPQPGARAQTGSVGIDGPWRSPFIHFDDAAYPPLSDAETARLRAEAESLDVLQRLKSRDWVTSRVACHDLAGPLARRHAGDLLDMLGDAAAPSGARQCAAVALAAVVPATTGLDSALIEAMTDRDLHVRALPSKS
jgi:hypothetical protein